MKQKSVQIPISLFKDLVQYHLFDDADPNLEKRIQRELQYKIDAMERRELYPRSK